MLTPVIDLKSKTKDEDEVNENSPSLQASTLSSSFNIGDLDWNVTNEYDPMWPNDYEKVAKGVKFIIILFCNQVYTYKTENEKSES